MKHGAAAAGRRRRSEIPAGYGRDVPGLPAAASPKPGSGMAVRFVKLFEGKRGQFPQGESGAVRGQSSSPSRGSHGPAWVTVFDPREHIAQNRHQISQLARAHRGEGLGHKVRNYKSNSCNYL